MVLKPKLRFIKLSHVVGFCLRSALTYIHDRLLESVA